MKIALLGYGKMGKMAEKTAVQRGHAVVKRIRSGGGDTDVSGADVAIEFSVPSAAFNNISLCLEQGVPVVSGTTGWLEEYDKAVALCRQKKGALLYASNFSLGVNLFFRLNARLAEMMRGFPHYEAAIEEVHHTQKRDAPSGTAITLAETVIANSAKTRWVLHGTAEGAVSVEAKRIAGVTGMHTVRYTGPHDTVLIQHTAHNREGFALGALMAAEWIVGKKGVYTMDDVLNL
ncbi:MAG: 4-hydroxy-tetrahydrodipicolinate reductase [Sinomicrobium sp.]|nr:4-hydroxy-tetrahydrodipicolinate reductase [Sinomicrobium sp.]